MNITKTTRRIMFNQGLHRKIIINILKDIYEDVELRVVLGFKGGTAAYLFYGLTRFSVDLDFDLLEESKKEVVLKKVKSILEKHGRLKQTTEKRFTLFFLLDYGHDERNLKVEISKRKEGAMFLPQSYMGITMLVMNRPDAVAGKLAALITRKKLANRDIYDIWFFLKQGMDINDDFLKEKTDMSLRRALRVAIKIVENLPKRPILEGLGELLNDKQKTWAKEHLAKDALFELKYYYQETKNKRNATTIKNLAI